MNTGSDDIREQKLRSFVERLTGGRITSMQRQQRWRPAWFVEVEHRGGVLKLLLRGDRGGDVMPFPDLRREANILTVLEQHGIPVPHVHGYCEDPATIVMTTMPGTRDLSQAASDGERRSVARQYMVAVAAMHRVPIEPFVANGIRRPDGPAEIALAALEAYLPLYQRTKQRPDALIAFGEAWLRRNVPRHRDQAHFVQVDAGQFLFHAGRVTALYDFETSLIGDPMIDLSTMRMRDSYEPLGDNILSLFRYYEEISGQPLDLSAIRYQTVVFALSSTMQFAGALAAPQPADPHEVYLEFDLALRRVLVLALAECLGVQLVQPAPVAPRSGPGPQAALVSMVAQAAMRIEPANEVAAASRDSVAKLVEFLAVTEERGPELNRLAMGEAAAILGRSYGDHTLMEADLERFVTTSGPDLDETLLRYFAAQVERRVEVFGGTAVGRSASHVVLPPIA
jgi:aminoglycoside phosphotransferase (APT) family kinase protein